MRLLVAAVFVIAGPTFARAQEPVMLVVPTYAMLEAPSAGQYARSLTNKSISSLMTKAVMPALTHEDSRYYRRGEGGVFSRLTYAASRSVVTRTRSGTATFNISEVAGTAAAAGLSNIYYSPAERTVSGTLTRWGTQLLWNAVANELREFWPDLRSKLRK